jgi:hypothetical protein
MKPKFPIRIEELPVFGGYLLISLERDVADFEPYLQFNTPFPSDYADKLALVEAAVSPVIFINQMKVLTFNIITGSYALRPLLNAAEIYFNSAGSGLNVLPTDMGLKQVRAAISGDNTEALILGMKNLNQNIFNNKALLITKGMLLVMQTALIDAAANIKTSNDL